MLYKKFSVIVAVLMTASLILSACATPTPEVIEKVVTQVVTQVVKETVKETVVVAGTPEIVEKEVTKLVEKEVTKIIEVEKEVVVTPTPEERSPVIVVVGGSPDTFDPAHMAGDIGLIKQVFDTLLTKDFEGNLKPQVATEWKQIDERTWEFKIREGLRATNGEVIDANDVAYSLNRVYDPEIGAKGHYLWLAGNMQLDHAEVVDNQTVHLFTKDVSGDIPELLWTWFILPQDYYSSTPLEELAVHPVGSGPFKFVEGRKGESYTIEANDDYWEGPPEVKKITFRIVPEMMTRIAEFNTGAADLLVRAPPLDLVSEIDPEYGRVVVVETLSRVIFGVVFYNDPAMADKRVRQALNYGIDVQLILDNLIGRGTRTGSFVNPPNVPPSVQPYPYDPEKARELLKEAGFEDRDGDGWVDRLDGSRLELTLQTPQGRWLKDYELSQAAAADWAKIGLYVEVEPKEAGTYISMLASQECTGELWTQYAGGGFGCQADISDFSNYTQWQPGGWKNDEFDDLFLEMTHSAGERAQELCYQLQEIMWEEAPTVYLYNNIDTYAFSNRIEWEIPAHGRNNFYTMRWRE